MTFKLKKKIGASKSKGDLAPVTSKHSRDDKGAEIRDGIDESKPDMKPEPVTPPPR